MAAKGIAPGCQHHMTISLNDVIREWEDAGYGGLLAEARKRRQEQERAGDEAVLRYFRERGVPPLPDGEPES